MEKEWFRQSVEETVDALAVDIAQGLAAEAAAGRLQSHGPNELAEGEKQSTIALFLEQFKNPLLIVLMVGAGVSLYADHAVDAIAIAVIVFINALISFLQEYNAQKSMDALKDMAAPDAFVRREGQWVSGSVGQCACTRPGARRSIASQHRRYCAGGCACRGIPSAADR